MGGMTIMCLAAARPELFGERVRGVALVSTSAGDLAPAGKTLAERLQLKLAPGMVTVAIGGARALERLRQLLAARPPAASEDGPRTALRRGRHRRHGGRRSGDHARLDGAVVRRLLPGARQPRQAAGAQGADRRAGGDPRRPERQADATRHSRQLAEALPDATLQIVERTGHMLTQERPQLAADAIGRLLDAATAD